MAASGPGAAPQVIETTKRITVSPRAVATPALKNRLTWAYADQMSGNAATSYLMASGEVNGDVIQLEKDDQKIDDLLENPLDQFDPKEAQNILNKYGMILTIMEQGSKCESCDWGLPVRQQGIALLMPYLNNMKVIARLISLKARLSVVEGDMDEAVRWLRVGYAGARHMDQQSILIQGLVAMGMLGLYNNAALDLIQSDKGPNMYWALTNLPNPMMDFRRMMETERGILVCTFPIIPNIKTKPITSETWREFRTSIQEALSMSGSKSLLANKGGMLDDTIFNALSGVMIYPTAKEYLKGHGYDDRRLDSMTAPQILMHYMVDSYEEACDETTKLAGLPYWEAIPTMDRIEKKMRENQSTNPLIQLTGSYSRALDQFGEFQRKIELMRTIEAIRAYAAGHEGKLPEKLSDMTQTPAGIDPFTGKAFEWKVEGGKGILSKAKVTWNVKDPVERYEITLRK
jgi:hypothetical protein